MIKPTKTTNPLHFEDLAATRFEDLSYQLVSRLCSWQKINHDGRTGGDEGADIRATRLNDSGTSENWAIQCKRYRRFTAAHAKKVVDEAVKHSSWRIDVLLLIVGCDVSLKARKALESHAAKSSIGEAIIWDASEMEYQLYEKFPEIRLRFFENSAERIVAPVPHPSDVRLLEKFRSLIAEKEMLFLSQHEFAAGAYSKQLNPFGVIYDAWEGVHYEFQDDELDALFRVVMEKNRKFMNFATVHLFPDDSRNGFLTSKTDVDRMNGMTSTTRVGIKNMNEAAHELWRAIDGFERHARLKIRNA